MINFFPPPEGEGGSVNASTFKETLERQEAGTVR